MDMTKEMKDWLKQNSWADIPSEELSGFVESLKPIEVWRAVDKHYEGGTIQFQIDTKYEPEIETRISFEDGQFNIYAHDGVGTAFGESSPNFKKVLDQAVEFMSAMMNGKRYFELSEYNIPF